MTLPETNSSWRTNRVNLHSLINPELEEFKGEFPREMEENEMPPNSKVPSEVRAAKNKEVRQTPLRKPTTQIWHGNELPICKAFCDTTLSRDFWFNGSVFISFFLSKTREPQRILETFAVAYQPTTSNKWLAWKCTTKPNFSCSWQVSFFFL